MSEAKFTKGEWEVKSTSLHPARIKVKDKKGMEGKVIGDVRNISDANLISSAPEMYELLEFISENPSETNVIEIRRLLAKARGEQND
ncbi:hypothetical protein VPHK165_0084 [Vibrio phage K165]|nr:putative coil containing protein [Vibrio phage 120E34-1]